MAVYSLAQESSGPSEILVATPHRYELTLTADEFSVLHSAALTGVKKYGGDADFRIRIRRDGDDLAWLVTVTDPRLIEIWGYWMAEKTAELVGVVDIDRLDDVARHAFRVVQSTNAKIAEAKANPIWDPITVVGRVSEKDGATYIETKDSKYKITGEKLISLAALIGEPVLARGLSKAVGHLEVTSFAPRQENALEVCVMSLCPFGQKALTTIIGHLSNGANSRAGNGDPAPPLVVRYIFYKKTKDGKVVFSSMHGEKEVYENLVEMVIRDQYPGQYHEYLLKRTAGGDDRDWKKVAAESSLATPEIERIESVIAQTRDELIEREYEYVAGTLGVYDGSPTYVWEGQPVADIRKLAAFSTLDFSSERCSEK
jgi:hypothetical protein